MTCSMQQKEICKKAFKELKSLIIHGRQFKNEYSHAVFFANVFGLVVGVLKHRVVGCTLQIDR